MKFKELNKRLVIAVIFTVCTGFLFMWGIALDLDKNARLDLMAQAKIVANSINKVRLIKLTGNESDVDLPDYARIKQQLYNVRTTNEACRFLYILSYDAKMNNVFFFVDSQLVTSKDYAKPGLIYDEVTNEFRDAVSAGLEAFVGPVTDRWGTLVTALVPLKEPDTGKVIAMLGMDVEADDWFSHLVQLSILPVGLMFLTTVLIVLTFILKMKTSELSKTVRLDSLTKLLSRKAILEHAEVELSRSIHSGESFSIVVLDIDNFKKINDRYGHQAGDTVLRDIASCFKQVIRKTDMAGRIGGEEFMISLPNTNEADAATIAEKIRKSIESLSFDSELYPGLSRVSASFGVSAATEESTNFENLYEQADKALYLSKHKGKNKVSIFRREGHR